MERTQTPDPGEVLAAVLTKPSYATQITTVAVRLLQRNGLEPVDARNLQADLTTAENAIVGTLPEAVRHTASLRARSVLPPLAGLGRSEYADRLRAAARELA